MRSLASRVQRPRQGSKLKATCQRERRIPLRCPRKKSRRSETRYRIGKTKWWFRKNMLESE